MNKMTKSKKYTGVYYRKRKDGDITYYFVNKNTEGIPTFHKVGLKSQKITEQYVFDKRSELILELKNGEVPKLLRSKNKFEIKFSSMANYYFDNHVTRSSERRRKLYEYRLEAIFGNKSVYSIKTKDV